VKRASSRPDRYLTTVLFTDIVDSTRLATELGDRGWHDLLEQHHELIRRELRRFAGREIDTAGDGFFAAFDAPARAVGCALTIASLMPELGLHIRAGVHSGEVEEAGGKLRGIAVHIGARVGASAVADEVLTSATVRDLVAGSGIDFEDRGVRELKGVSGEWHVYAAREGALFRSEFPTAAGAAGREVAAVRHDVQRRAQRRRLTIIGAAVAVLATAGAGAFLITRPPPSLASVSPNAAGLIDPASGRILAEVNTGNRPDAIAFGEGALWVANTGDDTVSRIDPATRLVVQTIEVGNGPSGLATGFGSVWVANSGERTVSRINVASNRVVQSITVGNGATAVATGAEAVWVTNAIDGTLSRIDPVTGTVSGVYPVGASPGGIIATDSAVWIADSSVGAVIRVDPSSGRTVASIGVGNGARAIAIANGDIWVANTLDGTVSRIDPKANRVTATIEVGEGPSGIVGSADNVWVASSVDGAVYRIDPATNAATRIAVGSSPQALAVENDELWFSARASSGSHRGGTLRVVGSIDFEAIDPAIAFDGQSNTLLSMTNDGLVAFQRTGGLAGATLVPDLAASLPRPTDGGTTYTFQLRPGIVYSDGQPVKASDFRRAIERQWTAPSDEQFAFPIGAPLYVAIVGAAECGQHRATCNLQDGILTDDEAGTVTFHLVKPDPDFLKSLALTLAVAVPASVPMSDVGNQPIPATGPYMIASFSPREVRLVRNPRFREWSRAARPDGYPDEIVWTNGHTPDDEVAMVIAGSADVMFGSSPIRPDPGKLEQVRAQYPSQVHPWVSGTAYLHMNVSIAPFDDPNVRHAVSLALDRGKLVEARGGSVQAQETCQVLLPNTQGYRPYCPYTLDPNPGGTWTAPDVAEARQLVNASGKAGASVTVSSVPRNLPLGEHVVAALNEIGFKATLKKVTLDDLFDPQQGPTMQSMLVNWYSDLTASASFFTIFTCNDPNNLSRFCDPAFDVAVKNALEIQQTNTAGAGDAWAAVDRMLVDAAPIAALVNQVDVDFVSARVGNFQHHPEWVILLDQLWVQ
jgi:peptide/nickel transport system substrate-binding protein